MYSIGQFSLITNTTKKTLRHYDEINLLKPSIIESNLYRYYDDSKIVELKTIKELKSFGLSLTIIKNYLTDKEHYSLTEILNSRLSIINEEIAKLTKQQGNINNKLNNKIKKVVSDITHPIGYYTFKNDPVIKMNYSCTMENMGEAIGKFHEYLNTNNINIKGDIMISLSTKEDSDLLNLVVFAYTDAHSNMTSLFEQVSNLNCLHSSYNINDDREQAYLKVFEYAKDKNIELGERVVLKFSLCNNKLIIDFFIEIIKEP